MKARAMYPERTGSTRVSTDRVADEVARLRRLLVSLVVIAVVVVLGIILVNQERDRECIAQGDEPTGGLIHGCEPSSQGVFE